ncbi:hypothetical protein J6590_056494 [Homalodisca vitripennis]|nr:hypothetical protein J6590_056494 [Homalodisca vitripennis]
MVKSFVIQLDDCDHLVDSRVAIYVVHQEYTMVKVLQSFVIQQLDDCDHLVDSRVAIYVVHQEYTMVKVLQSFVIQQLDDWII